MTMTVFIALASGKGGVGKTTTAINLCQALHDAGKKALLVDANFATPDVAFHLGNAKLAATLNDFLEGKKQLHDVVHLHPLGMRFLPASASYESYKKWRKSKKRSGMEEIFEHLDGQADIVLVDTAGGIHQEVMELLRNCDETLVVANPHLSAAADALKTIHLAHDVGSTVIGSVLNMAGRSRDELSKEEVEHILGFPVLAAIPFEPKADAALQAGVPLVSEFPKTKAAREFRRIAHIIGRV